MTCFVTLLTSYLAGETDQNASVLFCFLLTRFSTILECSVCVSDCLSGHACTSRSPVKV